MTINVNRTATLEPPTTTALTTTLATTIFTSDAKFNRVVEKMVLANATVGSCQVDVYWLDATPTSHLLWSQTVPSKTTQIVDIPILVSGNGIVRSLTATADAANDVTVTIISSRSERQAREN